MARTSAWTNFVQMLIAVIAGNLLYWLAMPYLPEPARHRVFRQDWGVVVDFWFCVVVFGVIKTVSYWRRKRSRQRS